MWSSLDMSISSLALSYYVFDSSTNDSVGLEEDLLLWEDPWIGGLTAGCIAPKILAMVRRCITQHLTIRIGLANHAWARGITGELSVDTTIQYIKLWAAVA
jgi:hypothetical protein